MMDWEMTYLPEHLWLAHLIDRYGVVGAVSPYDRLCDLADKSWLNTKDVFLGHISDFGEIPEHARRVLQAEVDQSPAPFGPDFRAVLALYPTGPAVWLANGSVTVTYVNGLALLRRLVGGLRDPHSNFASECRILAFRRILMKQRLHFPRDVPDEELTNAFVRYPNVDEESRRQIHQFVRMTMNVMLSIRGTTSWPGHFWRSNFSMLECR
jgi:hypothetical protein